MSVERLEIRNGETEGQVAGLVMLAAPCFQWSYVKVSTLEINVARKEGAFSRANNAQYAGLISFDVVFLLLDGSFVTLGTQRYVKRGRTKS